MTKDNIFVVGDVHGCYHTFMELLNNHWNRNNELLIQLGDLIDRGNFSPEVVDFSRALQNDPETEAVFLAGNHEYLAINHYKGDMNEAWFYNGGVETLRQFSKSSIGFEEAAQWFSELPLFWENEHVFVSHAGIGENGNLDNPYDLNGILWNRGTLKNIGKLQIIGHTPQRDGKPKFFTESNAYCIDTGAYLNLALTGIRISSDGTVLDMVQVPTKDIDLEPLSYAV
ncbi:metallophosphoesterase family protein [Fulvivirgaceae bacterium BMA10]|uniref:Metallophosphoesterase family protein n=1 Tax=Splendidivirga corallicola TaxID=3051826 RepID=A0ABT8KR13_9BACT|nr:metallophosphoesterase family protein [Fulvivirgaceae bacterium BMA10]